MFKGILIGLAVLLVAAAAIGYFAPADYTLEERITIQAAPDEIHPYLEDLSLWPEWTPWAKEDPTIVTTYGDETVGVGAHQSWTGESGAGELTITESDPDVGIAYDMAFVADDGKRIPATSRMRYEERGGQTDVVWSMEGTWEGAVPRVAAGWMRMFSGMMIGPMFRDGLENLKREVEA